MPDTTLERALVADGHPVVAGIDEAGRGPWAGPVVAAAVIFDLARAPSAVLGRLDDSKRLSAEARAALAGEIEDLARNGAAHFALGRAEVAEIDALNILQASLLAMRRAVAGLAVAPDAALIDGNRAPDLPCLARAVIKGDARSVSIAAASILAKVRRDEEMRALAAEFPGYGWETNMGYGTAAHQAGLAALGVTPHHRKSFAPIHKILSRDSSATPHLVPGRIP